jgi:hypothetical protein
VIGAGIGELRKERYVVVNGDQREREGKEERKEEVTGYEREKEKGE